ncbi:GGDEF domain-containing protein [Paractinoplanes ferrugineus]|uniref:GGDEF domain-containing protein n=1 Tax=Paractinoplanes ferrugineus TaxID=113564 RepID=UPI001EF1CFD7|nr:GGDEF domain-containing protein [Actinoplanes ferrugineus]
MRSDPLIGAAVAWMVIAAILFFALQSWTVWQVRTFWAFQLPLDALFAYCSWRVSRIATGPVRRFWLILTGVSSSFLIGDTFQTVLTFVDEPGTWSTAGGAVQSTFFAGGLVVVVVAMLLHPHPGRSGRARLAFWLDSASVLVAGAVMAWCFAVRPGQALFTTLGLAAAAITACFAAVKLILSGNAPMRRSAAISMMLAGAVTAIGVFMEPAAGAELPPYVYLVRLMPSMLIALGPRIQVTIARFDPAPFADRRRKPYSLLPYGAIALAFVALVVVMPQGVDFRLWGVVVGLGLICALVAGRQLVAFHDNTELIEQLREHETRLRRQALTDGLTGLANRTHFHEQVEAALAADPVQTSVLLLDLDGFKQVNDTFGHAAGDELLISVADKMRTAVRDGDLPARFGGDEFGILLRGCTGPEAEETAQRLLDALAEPVDVAGAPITANASIGAAAAEPGEGVSALIRRADVAMYAAKSAGKGTWKRYDTGMESVASFH